MDTHAYAASISAVFSPLLWSPLSCGLPVQEGQLCVGDHILSINSESVVGPGVSLQQVWGVQGSCGDVRCYEVEVQRGGSEGGKTPVCLVNSG